MTAWQHVDMTGCSLGSQLSLSTANHQTLQLKFEVMEVRSGVYVVSQHLGISSEQSMTR